MSKTISERIPVGRPFSLPLNWSKVRFFSSKKSLHVIFWLGFYLFNSLLEGSFLNDYYNGFYASFIKLPFQMAVVYFNVYYLLPKWIPTKKYELYFASLIVLLALIVLIKRYLIFEIIYPATCPVKYNTESLITFSNYFLMLNSEVYLIGLTSAIKMAMEWAKNIQITKGLEREKLEAELGLLKAQIQPHFFFNTLNNLYALTLKKSEQAPGVVQKLSELMSYLLYDCEGELVLLQDEIRLVQNYIDLEKLRFGKRLDLSFELKGDFYDKKIPPFIILPFVENAFKHGQCNLSNVVMKVSLHIEEEHLHLIVQNPIADINQEKSCAKGGIGLKNVQRRLDLLLADDYLYQITHEQKEFIVRLRIPLK